jgi:4-diphosphocytidyl-2-C-methyl-D-erythritol kinase
VETEYAPAKVNLYLHVTGREDEYHTLDSLVVFAGVHDTLTATRDDRLSLSITGPFGADLHAAPSNLVLRAAWALSDLTTDRPGARITLEKNLPIASGIGGGSSDAAAALRLLARLWGLQVPPRTLHQSATSLGADVPVCLHPWPARMGGIGDILSSAPALPDYGIALVNPGVAVPTGDVFRARRGPFSYDADLPAAWPDAVALARSLAEQKNDLEAPAIALCPAIGDVLAAIGATEDCLIACMSGSGATCFGLYPTPAQAEAAARSMTRAGWWCWGGAPWGFTPPPSAT